MRVTVTLIVAVVALVTPACAHTSAEPNVTDVAGAFVVELDATTAGARMRAGELTSHALTQAYLDRIEAMDRTLRSVIEVNPRALAEADALDAERAAGHVRGPLHGLPVVVKDNIDVAGLVNSAGSLALAGNVPKRDAFVVGRLRAAGAVILAKANLSEWANARSTHSTSGWSSRGGQTRSPYVLDRNPCGSSAGTAVAVAASLAMIGVGTETDGSITCPSAVNGLVGLKPTVGLVSRDGIIPIAISQDTAGPMGRTVSDVAILLNALIGVDAADPAGAAAAGHIAADYRALLAPDALAGKRLGVVRQAMGFLPAVDQIMERAIVTLKGLGATLVDVTIDTWGKWDAPELELMLYELKAGLDAYLAQAGVGIDSLAALIAWNGAHAALVMPHFGQELFLDAVAKGPLTDPAYLKARDDARRLAGPEGLGAALSKGKLDALVVPTASPSWPSDPVLGDHWIGGGTSIAAVAGTPSITVPAGDVRGLPVGMAFMGPAYSEAALLAYAYAFEQATHARSAPRYLETLAPE